MPKELPPPADTSLVDKERAEQYLEYLQKMQEQYLQDEEGPAWDHVGEDY
jgi:hypothetical protein